MQSINFTTTKLKNKTTRGKKLLQKLIQRQKKRKKKKCFALCSAKRENENKKHLVTGRGTYSYNFCTSVTLGSETELKQIKMEGSVVRGEFVAARAFGTKFAASRRHPQQSSRRRDTAAFATALCYKSVRGFKLQNNVQNYIL